MPPRTELEAILTGLWRELLGAATVGVHDDFFALGGHSLLATRLVARIRDRHAVDVPLISLFEHPTIARMADTIEAAPVTAATRAAKSAVPIAPNKSRVTGSE